MNTGPHTADVSSAVRDACAAQNVRQRDLCQWFDLSPTSVNERWHGKTPFTAYELAVIADQLDVEVGQLLVPLPAEAGEPEPSGVPLW